MNDAAAMASARPDLDAFDQLLEPAPHDAGQPSQPQPLASARASEAHSHAPAPNVAVEAGGPTLSEFADGFALYGDPILCAVLAGAGLGALGVFVVLRRAVFVTATLSTTAGLGVVLAFFLEIHHGLSLPPVACALAASLACTWLVAARPSRRLSRETLVALVYLVASALVVLLGARIAQEAHDVSAILFGSAVLVRPSDVWFVLGATLASLALLAVLWRPLTFIGFDRDGARAQGLPVGRLEAVFWAIFALEVSVTTRALGALPVFAFAVLPAAAGLFVARRVPGALFVAIALGVLSGALGYLGAFLYELPVGATQVATAAGLTLLAYAIARRH